MIGSRSLAFPYAYGEADEKGRGGYRQDACEAGRLASDGRCLREDPVDCCLIVVAQREVDVTCCYQEADEGYYGESELHRLLENYPD